MTTKTLTRADIAEALYNKLGFSHADSFKLIEHTFSLITDELATNRPVKISGFATDEPYSKKERMGRNPKSGTAHVITERTVLSFKPSIFLKNSLK